MKYKRDTYIHFNVFCKTALDVTRRGLEQMEDIRNVTQRIVAVLKILAKALGIGLPVFVSLIALLSMSAVLYYGGVGALFTTNPLLAGILLGTTGASFFVLRDERQIAFEVDRVVRRAFKAEYASVRSTLQSTASIPEDYQFQINRLVARATKELASAIAVKKDLSVSALLKCLLDLDFVD